MSLRRPWWLCTASPGVLSRRPGTVAAPFASTIAVDELPCRLPERARFAMASRGPVSADLGRGRLEAVKGSPRGRMMGVEAVERSEALLVRRRRLRILAALSGRYCADCSGCRPQSREPKPSPRSACVDRPSRDGGGDDVRRLRGTLRCPERWPRGRVDSLCRRCSECAGGCQCGAAATGFGAVAASSVMPGPLRWAGAVLCCSGAPPPARGWYSKSEDVKLAIPLPMELPTTMVGGGLTSRRRGDGMARGDRHGTAFRGGDTDAAPEG